MFKIIYPSSDATMYQSIPSTNTGLDEILEIGKRLSTSGSNYTLSRSVIKFDMDDVTNALSKYNINIDNCKFMLQLYTTHAKNLSAEYTIDANLVGDDWTNGTGYQNSSPKITNGFSTKISIWIWCI